MRLILTPENEEKTLSLHRDKILDGTARLVYNFYVDGQFVTDTYAETYQNVLDAYKNMGEITVEVELCVDD